MAKEIAETCRSWIEGMVQERGVDCGKLPDTFRGFFQLASSTARMSARALSSVQ